MALGTLFVCQELPPLDGIIVVLCLPVASMNIACTAQVTQNGFVHNWYIYMFDVAIVTYVVGCCYSDDAFIIAYHLMELFM